MEPYSTFNKYVITLPFHRLLLLLVKFSVLFCSLESLKSPEKHKRTNSDENADRHVDDGCLVPPSHDGIYRSVIERVN